MEWNKVVGQDVIKKRLKESIENDRVSHAQLFVGKEGVGALTLALAYAREIFVHDEQNENLNLLQHPDIHFSFPITTTELVPKNIGSKPFLKNWREFLQNQNYGNLYDWLKFLQVEKKQAVINVSEVQEIHRFLALNSFKGGFKIVIIWLPETMTGSASNKLLKILEEPPQKTTFLLVTEDIERLLPTIISRCQRVNIPRLQINEIKKILISQYDVDVKTALRVSQSAQGNLRSALHLLHQNVNSFETYFIQWVRNAFQARKKPQVLQNLVVWANEINTWSREEQKQFLLFCSETFRQALFENYATQDLVFMRFKTENFQWKTFSNFVHGSNIQMILSEINEAIYHIERNANTKIIFLDLSIKLSRYLHKKMDEIESIS